MLFRLLIGSFDVSTSLSNSGFPGTDSALFRAGRGLSARLLALSARSPFVRRMLNLHQTTKRRRVEAFNTYPTKHPTRAAFAEEFASHPRAQEVEQKRLDRMKLWAWPLFPQNWQCSTVRSL